jgi:tripartite-type tricarboxylate transporter receptor subunit TctC
MNGLFAKLITAGLSLSVVLGSAAAQEYPSRTIRLVNPFQAGGGLDVAARMIQPIMSQRLGQQIIIDNRPGAGGTVGAGLVAHSASDGYTILITTSGPIVNSLQAPISYDVKSAFQPITQVMSAPMFLVVPESSSIRSVSALIARGKDTKQATSYGHPGAGTATHFAAALFTSMTGSNFVGVPYKGAAGQAQDTIAGHVQFSFLSAPDAMSHLGRGLRALAVTSLKRTPLAPDVPTISEAGVPGYQFDLWYGLFAPANTPRPIIDRIREALIAAVSDETVRSRFLAVGMVPDPNTPEDFAAVVQKQMEVDTNLVKLLGLKHN